MAEARKKCLTGIRGLDTILNGGIPVGNTVLISGSAGTGKTTLSIEFLVHGAIMGEKGLYISVTEDSGKLVENLITYDFFSRENIQKDIIFIDIPEIYEKLGLNKLQFNIEDINLLIENIIKIVKEFNIKRVVIDSITSICYRLETEEKIMEFILRLGKALQEFGATTLMISELLPFAKGYSQYGVEEAIADGIILMGNYERRGDLLRTLRVIKMRGTAHSRATYVLELTSIGIMLVPLLKNGGE
ncbi:MAG: RAD55 family ATPase [Thermoplasmata archaeon]